MTSFTEALYHQKLESRGYTFAANSERLSSIYSMQLAPKYAVCKKCNCKLWGANCGTMTFQQQSKITLS